ncbi:MAG: hypothetical protein QOK16_3321 [Solirubrobacteraceae bacterium]|jgi:hypothetical protein|nr:hypothetical protein [Solirubrobacteraceae bacterium]
MNEIPNHQDRGARALTAVEECDKLIDGYGRHANSQRRLAWLARLAIVWSSALIPVSIVVSTQTADFFFGKLLPSLLGALAAAAGGATQVVRPHDRWRIFNRQRYLLEAERMQYVHRLGVYASDDAERLLLERVVDAHRAVTDEYQTLVPSRTAFAMELESHRDASL